MGVGVVLDGASGYGMDERKLEDRGSRGGKVGNRQKSY